MKTTSDVSRYDANNVFAVVAKVSDKLLLHPSLLLLVCMSPAHDLKMLFGDTRYMWFGCRSNRTQAGRGLRASITGTRTEWVLCTVSMYRMYGGSSDIRDIEEEEEEQQQQHPRALPGILPVVVFWINGKRFKGFKEKGRLWKWFQQQQIGSGWKR